MSFRAGVALTALLVLSLFAAAQSNSSRVEGTILNHATGEPLSKADVWLQQSGTVVYSQSSDDKGRFIFDNVAPGIYNLGSRKNGFAVARYGDRPANPIGPLVLNVSKGQSVEKLELKLIPGGVIAGRVLDQAGKPMVQTQVFFFQYAYVQGKKQLQRRIEGRFTAAQSQAVTNDRGEFRFSDLAPGEYYIAALASLPTVRGADSGPQERNVPTFYPSVIDPAALIPVQVTAGTELRDTNIHVRRTTVYSIRGKVEGRANAAAQVRLVLSRTDGFPPLQGATQIRPDGSFEFPYVVPGAYEVTAGLGSVLGVSVPCRGCSDLKVANSNLDNLTLQLEPATTLGIRGTLRAEGSDLQGSQVFLMVSEIDEYLSTGGRIWPVGADGAFTIQSGAAKYYWRVNGLPPGTFIKSARFNGQDVTNKIIDATSVGGGNLEIVVSNKSAVLAGSVVDVSGASKAGVRMTLWLKSEDPSNANGGVYEAVTDQNGGFRLSGLAPGNYYAAGWAEILPPGLGNSVEFLSRFNAEATAVTLEEAGQASQNARFISAQRIAEEIAKLP